MKVSDLKVKSYLLVEPDQNNREITLERVPHPGGYRWAIRSENNGCLNRDGHWEWEPRPSERDEEFFERCRFATEEEALAVFNSLK